MARRKYVKYPLPFEAWQNLKMKQSKINQDLFEITGKRKRVPLSRVIRIVSENPIYLNEPALLSLTKSKKRRERII